MPDLVEKFFKEGLTEAEEQSLSESLWASEDMAEKFAGLAREAYQRYGLPEPRLPGSPQTPMSPQNGLGPWLGVFVVITGLAVAYFCGRPYWGYLKKMEVDSGVAGWRDGSASPMKPMFQTLSTSERKGNENALKVQNRPNEVKPKSPTTDQRLRSDSATLPAISAQRVPDEPEQQGKRILASPVSTPINLDQNPSSDYSSLSIIVHQSKPGPLSVRVLDTRGVEVLPLYNGNLGPGHWVFEWNGRLVNGQQAGPGFYLIEVQSGLFVERKGVQIH